LIRFPSYSHWAGELQFKTGEDFTIKDSRRQLAFCAN